MADLYDCTQATQAMENVKSVMEGVYVSFFLIYFLLLFCLFKDVHPAADGICCPNRGVFFPEIIYTQAVPI